jgi:hypothetical protein
MYVSNGYSFVQNVIANEILKYESGIKDASIAVLIIPMQASELFVDKFVVVNNIFTDEVTLLYVLPMF